MHKVDFAGAIKQAIPWWDPSKHPRDRNGQFIEVGSLVHAFSGPGIPDPEVTGRVVASHYDQPTNRLFIGVQDSAGTTHWYRPKQLERIKAKATLKPTAVPSLPLPAVDGMYPDLELTGLQAPMAVPESLLQKAQAGEIDADDFDIHASELPTDFKKESGLADLPPLPELEAHDIEIPANKTPDDILDLIQVSFVNKAAKGTIPGSQIDVFDKAWTEFKAEQDFATAAKQLNSIMTMAKLGGKQRKRYKEVLSLKFGGHQAAEFVETPVVPEPAGGPLPTWATPDIPQWLAYHGYDENAMVFDGAGHDWVVDPGSDVAIAHSKEDGEKPSPVLLSNPGVILQKTQDGQFTQLWGKPIEDALGVPTTPEYQDYDSTFHDPTSESFDLATWIKERYEPGTPIEMIYTQPEFPHDMWAVKSDGKVDYWTNVSPGEWAQTVSNPTTPDELSDLALEGNLSVVWNLGEDLTVTDMPASQAAEAMDAEMWDDFLEQHNFDTKNHGYWIYGYPTLEGGPTYVVNENDMVVRIHKGQWTLMNELDHESLKIGQLPMVDTNVGGNHELKLQWATGPPDSFYADDTDFGDLMVSPANDIEGWVGQEEFVAGTNIFANWDQSVFYVEQVGQDTYAKYDSSGKPTGFIAPADAVESTETFTQVWPPSSVQAVKPAFIEDDIAQWLVVKKFSSASPVYKGGKTGTYFVQSGDDPNGEHEQFNAEGEFLTFVDGEFVQAGIANGVIAKIWPEGDDEVPDPEPDPVPVAAPYPNVYVGTFDAIYKHPQGAITIVSGDDVTKYGPDGKKKSTSATAVKLAEGHGAWQFVGYGQETIAKLQGTPAAPAKVSAKKSALGKKTAKKIDIGKLVQQAKEEEAAILAKEAGPSQAIIAEADEVLDKLAISMDVKGMWSEDVATRMNLVLNSPDYNVALQTLNSLMTQAKLGGKQRKRYKDALAKKHGVAEPTAPKMGVPAAPNAPGSSPGGWKPIVPTSTSGTPAGTTSMATANSMVNPNSMTPQQAKSSIQRQLSDRLKGKATKQQLVDAVLNSGYSYNNQLVNLANAVKTGKKVKVQKDQWNSGNWAAINAPVNPDPPEKVEAAFRETLVNAMIQCWAGTSNDSSPLSLSLQLAATDEFGLVNTYPWPTGKQAAAAEYAKHGALHRLFLREMYLNTQEWAKANGVTRVRLRRGMKSKKHGTGSAVDVRLRPMSSFTSNAGTASSFSGGGVVVEGFIPIEWVIGSAATGFGCKNEYEWVVLGGVHKMKVL